MRRLSEPPHLDLCCLQKPIIIACDSERVKDATFHHGAYHSCPFESVLLSVTQRAHDVYTSYQRCIDVDTTLSTLRARWVMS